MRIVKIEKIKLDKLKALFPGNEEMWNKYRTMRIRQLERGEIDIFVIEHNENYIGELTVNYKNTELENETIPNIRVYFEAFRIDRNYRSKGFGQMLIKHCIDYLINKGYTEFTVGVEDDNETAKHIYFKLGFNKAIDRGYGNEFDPSEYTLYLKVSS